MTDALSPAKFTKFVKVMDTFEDNHELRVSWDKIEANFDRYEFVQGILHETPIETYFVALSTKIKVWAYQNCKGDIRIGLDDSCSPPNVVFKASDAGDLMKIKLAWL